MNNEDDTFDKLRRKPIKEVVHQWLMVYGPMISQALPSYVEHEHYTLEEFLNEAHHQLNLGKTTSRKEWVSFYIEYHGN